jgi:hypothetical protein
MFGNPDGIRRMTGCTYLEGGLYVDKKPNEKKPNFWYPGAVSDSALRLYGLYPGYGQRK